MIIKLFNLLSIFDHNHKNKKLDQNNKQQPVAPPLKFVHKQRAIYFQFKIQFFSPNLSSRYN